MDSALPNAGRPLPWRRATNPYALALALLVHVALLTSAVHWQSQRPVKPPPKPVSTEVALLLPKPPPPRPQPAAAERPAPKALLQQLALQAPPPLQRESTAPAATPSLSLTEGLAGPIGAVNLPAARSTAAATGAAGEKLFQDCADTPDRRMVAEVYRLPTGITSVSAMQGLQPAKTVCLAQLNIAPRSFREGFPGMEGVIEWFGLDIRFTVNVTEPGVWDVMLMSDDGAILSIDGVEVVNNDGIHAAQAFEATVRLAAGERNFRVRYFQGPREGIALMLAWKRPGGEYQYLPRDLIGRPRPQGQ